MTDDRDGYDRIEAAELDRTRREVARLQGQIQVLEVRVGAQDAADEHHRAELDSARAEVADLRVALKESEVRVEEWRRLVGDLKERLADSERSRQPAEQERAAVIAALGRRARRQFEARDGD